MRTGLVLASVVMVCSGAVLANTSDDPALVVAAPAVVKQELTLRKITRDHDSRRHGNRPLDSGQIDFLFYATDFESEWICWSKSPNIVRLTDHSGKSLFMFDDARERQTWGGGLRTWGTDDFGSFQSVDVQIKNDQIDRFGTVEAVAEIELAKDLEYIDLGELNGLERQVEVGPGCMLRFKAHMREKSFGFFADVLCEDSGKTTKLLVGLETFDQDGKPNQKVGWSDTGFQGTYLIEGGKPIPHTGRLVFAKRTERIPLRFSGKDVVLGGMSLKDVETITVQALKQKIDAKQLTADEIKEVFSSSVRLGREDLANALIDSGAPVTGQLFAVLPFPESKLSRADSEVLRERLFLRQIEVSGQNKNTESLESALSLTLLGNSQKFIPAILKWNPPLIWKRDTKRNHLTTMRLFRTFVPEIADAYAKEVLAHGPDFEFAFRDGFTEFLAAAYMGDHARLSAMIKAGTDINQKTEFGGNALAWACISPHTTVDTLKLLFDAGVSMNQGDDDERSEFNWAVDGKRYDFGVELIRRGVLKTMKPVLWRDEAFHRAGGSGSVELVQAIFDNLLPTDAETASAILFGAGANGCDDIVRIALRWIEQSNIDPKRQKQMIERVAAEAVRKGKLDTAILLRDALPK